MVARPPNKYITSSRYYRFPESPPVFFPNVSIRKQPFCVYARFVYLIAKISQIRILWHWLDDKCAVGMAALERADFIIVAAPFHIRKFYCNQQESRMGALVATLAAVRLKNSDVQFLMLFPFLNAKTVLNSMPYLHMLNYRSDDKFRVFTSIPHCTGPPDAGYRLCLYCDDWLFHTSRHCKLCNTCHLSGFRPWEYCQYPCRQLQDADCQTSQPRKKVRCNDAACQTSQPHNEENNGSSGIECVDEQLQMLPCEEATNLVFCCLP